MVDRGLDTIAYVPDIVTQTTMYNVVEDSQCFTLATVRTSVAPQLALYDEYYLANDKSAMKFLLSSISKEFALGLRMLIPFLWFGCSSLV